MNHDYIIYILGTVIIILVLMVIISIDEINRHRKEIKDSREVWTNRLSNMSKGNLTLHQENKTLKRQSRELFVSSKQEIHTLQNKLDIAYALLSSTIPWIGSSGLQTAIDEQLSGTIHETKRGDGRETN